MNPSVGVFFTQEYLPLVTDVILTFIINISRNFKVG